MTSGLENGRVEWLNFWEQWGTDNPGEFPTAEAAMSLVHPDDRDRLARLLEAYLSGEVKEFESEHRARHRDGSYHWMLTRGAIVRDPQGKPLCFSGGTVDITDLKRAEEALRESEQRFRGTFENAAVGIAHLDAAGRYLSVNQRFCDITGYGRAELLTMSFPDVTHPDDLVFLRGSFASLMRGEIPSFSHEKRYLRKDGSILWGSVSVSLQHATEDRPAYAIGICQDVSERKRLEEELRASEHRFRTFVDHAKLELDPADFCLRAALGDTLRALAMRAHKNGAGAGQPRAARRVGDAGRLEVASGFLKDLAAFYAILAGVRNCPGVPRL